MPGNYFQNFDFAQGGSPLAPPTPGLDRGGPWTGPNVPPNTTPYGGPLMGTGDDGVPPTPPTKPAGGPITLGNFASQLAAGASPTDLLKLLGPVIAELEQSENGQYDPRYKAATELQNDLVAGILAESRNDRAAAAKARQDATDKAADYDRAVQIAQISAGATLGASAEATRRQGLQQEWQTGEAEKTRGFTAGESQKTRQFESEQNALDREIRRVQNEIAQGTLNLQSALGQLQRWLEAQQYTLPEGAEFVPGFQPGGAVQEGARLAGVGYNPANFKANTVPFDPGAMVRQTMGR